MKKTKLSLFAFSVLFLLACNQQSEPDQPVAQKKDSVETPERPQPEISVNPYASVDISPMDMSYFPVDYPKLKMANPNMEQPVIRLIYSRPHLQRRALFNGILHMDEPWRLGANESSEINFYKTVTIQGKRIPAGRYIIYGIPHDSSWTIILNSNIDSWGLKQDPAKDVGRFEIPISTNTVSLEYFTMVFEKTGTGADLVIAWADVIGRLPIRF